MSEERAGRPLAGKRALVTGGARRIGKSLALALAQAGADVAITYWSSEAEAAGTVRAMGEAGVQAVALRCDVRDEASVGAAVAAAVERMGGLDLLVNNAGAFENAVLEEISLEAWDSMFAVNTRGPFLVARAALRYLRVGDGRIINLGSLGGMHPWTTHGHYCASKAALHMLSQTMAKAWAPELSVNCVAPGMVAIDGEDAGFEGLAAKTPMARNGRVEDVIAAVMFFATAPRFITGQVLAVDGGLGL